MKNKMLIFITGIPTLLLFSNVPTYANLFDDMQQVILKTTDDANAKSPDDTVGSNNLPPVLPSLDILSLNDYTKGIGDFVPGSPFLFNDLTDWIGPNPKDEPPGVDVAGILNNIPTVKVDEVTGFDNNAKEPKNTINTNQLNAQTININITQPTDIPAIANQMTIPTSNLVNTVNISAFQGFAGNVGGSAGGIVDTSVGSAVNSVPGLNN